LRRRSEKSKRTEAIESGVGIERDFVDVAIGSKMLAEAINRASLSAEQMADAFAMLAMRGEEETPGVVLGRLYREVEEAEGWEAKGEALDDFPPLGETAERSRNDR